MLRTRLFVLAAFLACEPEDPPFEDPSSSSSVGSTTDSCPDVAACNYCPDVLLCEQPCDVDAAPCSNEQGDSMTCTNGAWLCQDEPSREGPCSDLCAAAPICEEEGCEDGIELQLFTAGAFDPGAYEIVIARDGFASTCTFVISDDIGCELPPCVTDTTCNASYELAAPPRITLRFPVSDELLVSVARDGDVLVEATPLLEYELVAPNGPGCMPVCGVATPSIDVP